LELVRDADETSELKSEDVQSAYDFETDVLLDAKVAYPAQQRIESVEIVLPPKVAGQLLNIRAKEAVYRRKKEGRRAGWELVGATSSIDLDRLAPSAQKILYTLPSGNHFLVSEVTPEQLTRHTRWIEYSSTAELAASLRNPSLGFGADQAVFFHGRLLRPLNNFVLLLLGLPFVLGRENRNFFISMAICLLVSAGFFTVVTGCQYLGEFEYLSPALSAWAPVVLFGSALPALLDMVQT
jgi:lipopolysaccharide export system permease protein